MRIKATVKAVNELAQKEAARVRELLEAGARVAHAQAQALRGKAEPEALRTASRELAQLIESLTARAEELLAIKPSPTTRRTIAQTLRAAATGAEETRKTLERGELVEDLEPESVFGLPGDLPSAPREKKPSAAEKRELARRAHQRTVQLQKVRTAETKAAELERVAQQLEQAAWHATREAEKARERATAARHEAERLRAESQRADG
jgi:hypothetical protein